MKTPSEVSSKALPSYQMTDEDYEILEEFVNETPRNVNEPGTGGPKSPIVGPKPPVDDPQDAPLTKPAKEQLTYLDLPAHRRATDTTEALTGYGRSTTNSKPDVLSKLTVGDEILLLAENNIHLSAKPTKTQQDPIGSMHGYRMVGSELDVSDESVVRFKGLKLIAENVGRRDNFSYAYRQFASSLNKNLSFKGELGAGVPDIFEFSTSASHQKGVVYDGETIEMHFQASQEIPKARVVLKKGEISLDDEFVGQVEAACNRDNVNELLTVLQRGGQFVPLSIVLGGRIVLSTSKTLTSKSQFDAAKTDLHAAASGRYVYDGVTIKGDAAAGGGTLEERDKTLTTQAKALHMEVIGGDQRESSSESDVLGTHWIDTVGPFLGWRTIGFEPKSLVPIIEFLPKGLKDKCKTMLRKHFVAHLSVEKSDTAGHAEGLVFQRDVKRVTRLQRLVVNREGNIDGMKLFYQVYEPGQSDKIVEDKVGKDRGKSYDVKVPELKDEFGPGETIMTLKATVDTVTDSGVGLLRQIKFITNEGNRYPGGENFYGKNKGDKEVEFTLPRVRGFFGYSGGSSGYIHSIGLLYLKLADNVTSRDYLLAMEPYLFPTQNYVAWTDAEGFTRPYAG